MSSAGSRHRRNNNRSGTLPVVIAALAVVAVIAVVVMVKLGGTKGGDDNSATQNRGTSTSGSTALNQVVPVDVTECVAGLDSASRLIEAGKPAVQHWQDYVSYLNAVAKGEPGNNEFFTPKDVAGKAGPGDIERFREAEREYDDVTAYCPTVDEDTGERFPSACVSRAKDAKMAIEATRALVADFKTQLSYNSRNTSGELSQAAFEAARERLRRESTPKLARGQQAMERFEGAAQCTPQSAGGGGPEAQ